MLITCVCICNHYNSNSYVAMVYSTYLVQIIYFEARTRRNVPKSYVVFYPDI